MLILLGFSDLQWTQELERSICLGRHHLNWIVPHRFSDVGGCWQSLFPSVLSIIGLLLLTSFWTSLWSRRGPWFICYYCLQQRYFTPICHVGSSKSSRFYASNAEFEMRMDSMSRSPYIGYSGCYRQSSDTYESVHGILQLCLSLAHSAATIAPRPYVFEVNGQQLTWCAVSSASQRKWFWWLWRRQIRRWATVLSKVWWPMSACRNIRFV